MIKKMYRTKRHFQLLEVMIAMLLIVTCVAPALHIYMNMYKLETQSMQNYEADHLARLLYVEIVEQLYLNAIPYEDILSGTDRTVESAYTEQLNAIGFTAHYNLSKMKQKTVKGKPRCLIDIKIYLENKRTKAVKTYNYLQMIEIPPPPKDDKDKSVIDPATTPTQDVDQDDDDEDLEKHK